MQDLEHSQAPQAPRRRWALAAGVGAAAAAAGAGLGWWRLREGAVEPGSPAPPGFWGQTFDGPAGGSVAFSGMRGRPLLLNFWATWCPPCVDELPLLDRFFRQNAPNGWQVVGLAIDQPSAVRAFLGKMPLSFPVGMAGLGGTELARSLGNTVGGLPFSVVLGADGGVLGRRMGRLSESDLAQWVRLK